MPGWLNRGKIPLACCVIFVAVAGVFLPAVHNGFVNYDDPVYVVDNTHVQGGVSWAGVRWAFTTTEASNWHPLTWLSHMLDWQLFGVKPWGHHLTSVLLHATNSALLFLVFRSMTGAFWRSLAVALLFGLHPLRVQSVVWVAERKDVLSLFFGLLSLYGYGQYARASSLESRRGGWNWYLLALFFFVLGLMSKPTVVTLPFAFLLLDYWPLQRWRRTPVGISKSDRGQSQFLRLLAEKAPFFAFAAAASMVTLMVQQEGGAIRTLESVPLVGRVENALVGYCWYLEKICWPVNLAVFYPRPGVWPLAEVLSAAGVQVVISALALVCRHKRPYLWVGWLWYLGTMVPMIGLVQAGAQSIADRYTYLPSIGLFVALTWSAQRWTIDRRRQALLAGAAAGTVLLACTAVTRWQISFWRDSETLFRRALAITSDNPLARVNLGMALAEKRRPGVVEQLDAALRLAPDDPELQRVVGNAFWAAEYPENAIAPLQRSLRSAPERVDTRLLLAQALEKTGRWDPAIAQYREILALRPNLAEAHFKLGIALGNRGRFVEAAAQFREALGLRPDSVETLDYLGGALGEMGHSEEAVAAFEKAIGLKPEGAELHYHLGLVLLKQGQTDKAISELREALRLKPNFADARVNLGVTLYNKGAVEEAIVEFEQALRLQPDHPLARRNLEILRGTNGGAGRP